MSVLVLNQHQDNMEPQTGVLVPVRFMVTKPAPESGETISTEVEPGESLNALNTKHFGNYVAANSRVKWIHLGRTLEHRLPANIEPGTVFHVYARYTYLHAFPVG